MLKDLNLTIYPGECVALVGASGSGKSTLAGVVGRVWDVQAGEVCVGIGSTRQHDTDADGGVKGVDVRDVDVNWLRKHVVHVPQQPALLSASIAENIRFGLDEREMPDEVMWEAARLARVHEFIVGSGGEQRESAGSGEKEVVEGGEKGQGEGDKEEETKGLPQGYDTHLGENAGLVSGGQAQYARCHHGSCTAPDDHACTAWNRLATAFYRAWQENCLRCLVR